jgi:hypothetical protein
MPLGLVWRVSSILAVLSRMAAARTGSTSACSGSYFASQGANKQANSVWAQQTDIHNNADGVRKYSRSDRRKKKAAWHGRTRMLWKPHVHGWTLGANCRSAGLGIEAAVIRAFPGLPLQPRLPRSPVCKGCCRCAAHPASAFLQLPSTDYLTQPCQLTQLIDCPIPLFV